MLLVYNFFVYICTEHTQKVKIIAYIKQKKSIFYRLGYMCFYSNYYKLCIITSN